jgi:hypothetical protein
VRVRIDHDTAELAVDSILAWWKQMGSKVFPKAIKLLIMADAGAARKSNRVATVACLGIMRLDQGIQLAPRNHGRHHVQRLLPTALPSILLKACLACQGHLLHRILHPLSTLSKLVVDLELVQRLLRRTSIVAIRCTGMLLTVQMRIARAALNTLQ